MAEAAKAAKIVEDREEEVAEAGADRKKEEKTRTEEELEKEIHEAYEKSQNFAFKSEDARRFFRNKYIVVIGDSIMRGVYKDLVCWLQTERLLLNTKEEIKGKAEKNFLNDRLVYCTMMTDGLQFLEVREFISEDRRHRIQYYFVTRAYSQRMEHVLQEIKNAESGPPDLILMNSCLWDISRYGERDDEEALKNYGETLSCLLNRVRVLFKPEQTMFIWLTAPPLASKIVGKAFLIQGLEFGDDQLRMIVVQANTLASQVCIANGIDVLDLHYFLKSYIDERQKDGVHWSPLIHRHISNLIVAFIASTYSLNLPEHVAKKFQTLITRNQSREQLSWCGDSAAATSSKDVAWSKPKSSKGPGDKSLPTIDETLPSFLQKQGGRRESTEGVEEAGVEETGPDYLEPSSSYTDLPTQLVNLVQGISSDKMKEVMRSVSPSLEGLSEAERKKSIPVCYRLTMEQLDELNDRVTPPLQEKARDSRHSDEEEDSPSDVSEDSRMTPESNEGHDSSQDEMEPSHSTSTASPSSEMDQD